MFIKDLFTNKYLRLLFCSNPIFQESHQQNEKFCQFSEDNLISSNYYNYCKKNIAITHIKYILWSINSGNIFILPIHWLKMFHQVSWIFVTVFYWFRIYFCERKINIKFKLSMSKAIFNNLRILFTSWRLHAKIYRFFHEYLIFSRFNACLMG